MDETTLLEIISKSHLENVWSRILAFYFSPAKEHRLYEMLLKSLFDTIGEDFQPGNLKEYKVRTEVSTNKGNRIDIVIESNSFVIGIENKVNSPLYNDLSDYANTIDTLARERKSFKIVLSKYENIVHSGFLNITYAKFIEFIKKNAGSYYSYANTKYFILFFDFIDNIEKNLKLKNMVKNVELFKFLQDNTQTVSKLINAHNEILTDLDNRLYELKDLLYNDVEIREKFEYLFPADAELDVSDSMDNYNGHLFYIQIFLKNNRIVCYSFYIDDERYIWQIECNADDKYADWLDKEIKDVNNKENNALDFQIEPSVEVDMILKKIKESLYRCFDLIKYFENIF